MVEALDFPYRVGRIARAHGLRGEIGVQFFRRRDHAADPRRLELTRLAEPLPIEVEHPDERLERLKVTHVRWLDPIRAVMRVDGVRDRDAAEDLIGAYVDVDPARCVPEIMDEVDACFDARVVHADTEGTIGRVEAIRDNGAQALLEVEVDDEAPFTAWIPVVPEIVVEIGADAAGRWVRVRPLPGLLEVNR